MIPESSEVRWHAATSAFEDDQKQPNVTLESIKRGEMIPDNPPEWSPPLSEVLVFIVAVAIVTFVLVGAAVVLG